MLDVVAAAHGVDAVESRSDANRAGVEQGAGAALAQALKLDMAQWYKPTAAGYFARISKAASQAAPAPAWHKLKKGELAVLAERETAERGWLLPLLR